MPAASAPNPIVGPRQHSPELQSTAAQVRCPMLALVSCRHLYHGEHTVSTRVALCVHPRVCGTSGPLTCIIPMVCPRPPLLLLPQHPYHPHQRPVQAAPNQPVASINIARCMDQPTLFTRCNVVYKNGERLFPSWDETQA